MKTEQIEIELGSKVKDRVTGFCGIAVARTKHLYMCDRYTVQPPIDKDGKIPEAFSMDGFALEVLEKPSDKILENQPTPAAKVGGAHAKAERF